MTITKLSIVSWICVCFLLCLYGCAPIQSKPEEVDFLREDEAEDISVSVPERQYFTHKIKWSGENIVRISGWYTGAENNWLKIIQVNPSIDPERIKIGDSILIPEDIMKTHEPMPKGYRGTSSPPDKKTLKPSSMSTEAARPVNVLPSTGEIELFGPIYEDVDTSTPDVAKPLLPLETLD